MDIDVILKELLYYSNLKNLDIKEVAKYCKIDYKSISDLNLAQYIKLCAYLGVAPYLPFLAIEDSVRNGSEI